MSTSIDVHKKNVKQLLESGKENLFVIPEYQRPYAWTDEQIQTLFDDLWEFTVNNKPESKATYFLGCIVSYDENGEQQIIDGQQRITSIFLLLRAIYTMLEKSEKTAEVEHFLREIKSILWQTNKLTGVVDYDGILLSSRVMNNDGNDTLRNILATGETEKNATDNYSKNYNKFVELLENVAKTSPLMIYRFIYAILNQAILLPITADSQDTALTIFSTLNNRGLQLSDADIFKAQIYNKLKGDEKDEFIEKWKNLDEEASNAKESIQQLFYYYMFYLRAQAGDYSTTLPGVRKYYTDKTEKTKRLFAPDLIDNLAIVLNLWKVITKHEMLEDEKWSQNAEILKTLDTLSSYPNEYWKYPIVIYYLPHRDKSDFEINFAVFLKKLSRELLIKYLITPTVNAVKTDVLKLNVEIIKSAHPLFDFKEIDFDQLDEKIKVPHRSAVRMLLKIIAYDKQDELLPESWEIEHILPQKWQNEYFLNNSEEEVKEKLEHIGNKLPFEKKLNITAGASYFGKKREAYSKSAIAVTREMAEYPTLDWLLANIVERDAQVIDLIKSLFRAWNENYQVALMERDLPEEPSAEQMAMIEAFKKKGWIK